MMMIHSRLILVVVWLLQLLLFIPDKAVATAIRDVEARQRIPGFLTEEIHERLRYRTEPTFWPETFNVTTIAEGSLLADGYIFISPIFYSWGWGPQIYDIYGNLVWYGNSSIKTRTQDFKTCRYLGSEADHLCWHENRGYGPYEKQHAKRIFNNHYEQVGVNYTHPGDLGGTIDGHEFNVINNGESFLWPVGKVQEYDLSPYRGSRYGAVRNVCFQEITIKDEKPVFEWCFLDHFDVTESTLYFPAAGQHNQTSPIAGRGTRRNPWDFFHMNSIDKNKEGDYLMSGRHTDQIMKIAGNNNVHGVEPGTVLWRLGGHHSDFKKTNDFLFTKQHSVRYVSTTANETVFTILDNAWEGFNMPSARYSSGMEISVNNVTMEATMTRQWIHPERKVTRAQGNLQNLPNGNVFIEWGARREITEFDRDGEVLYHLKYDNGFGSRTRRGRATYRGFKFPWKGYPKTPPKLIAYANSCDIGSVTPLLAYVSWNGATEVKQWRFETANSKFGPWRDAGTYDKTGFETKVDLSDINWALSSIPPYVSVQALDADGTVLGDTVTATFVPDDEIAEFCDVDGCMPCYTEECTPESVFKYDHRFSRADTCARGGFETLSIVGLLVGLLFIEGLSYLATCAISVVDGEPAYQRLVARRSDLTPEEELVLASISETEKLPV